MSARGSPSPATRSGPAGEWPRTEGSRPGRPVTLPRWVAACLGGEVAGIATAAAAMAVLNETVGESPDRAGRLIVWVAMVLAGALEGLALGGLTWLALRRQLPSLPARRWVGATVALAVSGWALGMLPSTLGAGATSASASGAAATEPPVWLVALLAATGGLAAGAAFGAVQAWALRDHATGRAGWVGVNVAGWAIALAWIVTLAALPGPGWPVAATAALGVAAGLGSGLSVGIVTGLWLPKLQPTEPLGPPPGISR